MMGPGPQLMHPYMNNAMNPMTTAEPSGGNLGTGAVTPGLQSAPTF